MKNRILLSAFAFFTIALVVAGSVMVNYFQPAQAAGDPERANDSGSMAAMEPAIAPAYYPGAIQVTGQGKVRMKPDMAIISLGVQTEHENAKMAQQNNAKAMTAVIDAVKAAGVDEKDIQTSGYSMYPQYQYYGNQTPKITGYTVSANISVTVRDVNQTGQVMDAAAGAGANMAGGISFDVSDRQGAYLMALEAAMDNAKGKAEALARSMDITLGLPAEVTEQSGYSSSTYYDYNKGESAPSADGGYATPVQTGELEINATVNVRYGY